jgi:NADH-quinone oxidoreductase subunit K
MSLPLSTWTIILIAIMGLIGAGFYGLLISRNLIKIIVALQILVKGAILAMILAGKLQGQVMLGQSLAITIIVVDTIVAVIGLALAVQVRRHCGTLDLQALSSLRR